MSDKPNKITLDFFNKFSEIQIDYIYVVNRSAIFRTIDFELFIHIPEDVYRELEKSKANKPYYIRELLPHAKYVGYFNDDDDYVYESEDYKLSF
jgi:hypothetical protein